MNVNVLNNFCPSWNHHKLIGFVIISGVLELNGFNLFNVRFAEKLSLLVFQKGLEMGSEWCLSGFMKE